MIDVLLVLLIIFMLLIPTVPTGEKALVPRPSDDQTPTPKIIDQTVVLQLIASPGGPPTLKLNEDEVVMKDLQGRLKAIFEFRSRKVIFLKADAKIEWDEVAQVIDSVHTAGIESVGLMTTEMR